MSYSPGPLSWPQIAARMAPRAKRTLLTAYADTEAAIAAVVLGAAIAAYGLYAGFLTL